MKRKYNSPGETQGYMPKDEEFYMNKPINALPILFDSNYLDNPKYIKALNNEMRDYDISSIIENDEYFLLIKINDIEIFNKRINSGHVTAYVTGQCATIDFTNQTIVIKLTKDMFYKLRELSKQMPDVQINRIEK